MTTEFGRTSYLLLLVGLLGLFVWNTQGQSCSNQAECEPNVVCELITWFCNGSSSIATPTAAPTPDPLSQRCCEHLDSCGDDTIVAGWVAVRNTSITIDNVAYSVEWLDTFVTQGNVSLPAVIKSAYVGSWSTLRNVAMEFPSQMFVAEPTNSCTVDGEPKWPEWYQVTVNIMADSNMDETLEIEERREKQCLCDVTYDCINSVCQVKTENITNSDADLGKVDAGLEENVNLYCQENLTATNYSASSYFAVGFEPKNSELDTWQLNTSVEAGWAPELDDNDMWIKIHLPHDMMVSGLITQGVGLNAERRVDLFKVGFEKADGSSGSVAADKIFKAGARLDTKLTNYFPVPVKANAIKITVTQPCDPYYVGLRVQLIGCPWCDSNNDCTTDTNGVCVADEFCTYEEVTTESITTTAMPTTKPEPSTIESTTAKQTTLVQTTAQPSGQISTTNSPNSAALTTTAAVTTEKPTTVEPTTVQTPGQTPGQTTVAATGATSATTSKVESTAANADTTTSGASTKVLTLSATTKQTTKASTIHSTLTAKETTTDAEATTTDSMTTYVATTSPEEEIVKPILNKIDEVTGGLDEKVKGTLIALILPTNLTGTSVAAVNITKDVIQSGLDVIRNVTTVANTTQNEALQRKILEGGWNFMIVVSQNEGSFLTEDNNVDETLFVDFLKVGSLVLDTDRKETWHNIQKETAAGPIGLVASIEDVAIEVGNILNKQANASGIIISEANLDGVIAVRKAGTVKTSGFTQTFDSKEDTSGVETKVTITNEQFKDNKAINDLSDNSTLVVVVLKFKSIEELLVKNDVEDQTKGKKRIASSVLSIQVVADGKPRSVPLAFKLGHSKGATEEKSRCNFWVPVLSGNEADSKTAGNWSSAGCETKDRTDNSAICNCNHMTNFAILMWLGDEKDLPDDALETISKVGCYVSIAALAVAIGLLIYLKSSLSSERIIIHMHLMSVTLVALTIFVLGASATDNEMLCKFITIALHFFFMSMFSWMLVEGIHLYRQVISVFESEKSRMWVYFAVGWGIPVLVVTVGTAIFFSDYGTKEFCWLNQDDSIWVFMGPIIPTIAVNIVVLIMVSRIVMSASKLQQEKPAFSSVKAGLRSSLLLLPIMGVTWIFGYFQHLNVVFRYAFTTLNSFQGFFIALFHCFMSTEVNNALKQKIKRVKDSSMGGGSTMDSLHPKCLMNADKAPLYTVISPLDIGDDLLYDMK